MSPACGCEQSVRFERLLNEAAADSWPHSGLAEILSIAHATPRSCGVISGTQEMRKCRSLERRRTRLGSGARLSGRVVVMLSGVRLQPALLLNPKFPPAW